MNNMTRNSQNELFRILDAPTYSISEASRLVGITRWRINRWLKGYEYTYYVGEETREGHQESVVTRNDLPRKTYASFLDLIDLLFVKRFLEHGFSLQFIRMALEEARERLGTPHFARDTFFLSGKHIILQMGTKSKFMVALLTGGQGAMPEIIKQLGDKIDFEEVTGFGFASRWYPLGRDGMIVVDPQVSFGRPTILGRSIATENIYDLYLGESKQIDFVSHWFEIPARETQAAVNYEASLVA